MLGEDRKRGLLRLAYYACAIYAVTAAALLHWRMDEPILGYDPDHDFRAFRVFFLLVISGLSVYAGRSFNTDRNEAMDAMLKKFGIEPPTVSASLATRWRWAHVAGIVLICSVIFIAW